MAQAGYQYTLYDTNMLGDSTDNPTIISPPILAANNEKIDKYVPKYVILSNDASLYGVDCSALESDLFKDQIDDDLALTESFTYENKIKELSQTPLRIYRLMANNVQSKMIQLLAPDNFKKYCHINSDLVSIFDYVMAGNDDDNYESKKIALYVSSIVTFYKNIIYKVNSNGQLIYGMQIGKPIYETEDKQQLGDILAQIINNAVPDDEMIRGIQSIIDLYRDKSISQFAQDISGLVSNSLTVHIKEFDKESVKYQQTGLSYFEDILNPETGSYKLDSSSINQGELTSDIVNLYDQFIREAEQYVKFNYSAKQFVIDDILDNNKITYQDIIQSFVKNLPLSYISFGNNDAYLTQVLKEFEPFIKKTGNIITEHLDNTLQITAPINDFMKQLKTAWVNASQLCSATHARLSAFPEVIYSDGAAAGVSDVFIFDAINKLQEKLDTYMIAAAAIPADAQTNVTYGISYIITTLLGITERPAPAAAAADFTLHNSRNTVLRACNNNDKK